MDREIAATDHRIAGSRARRRGSAAARLANEGQHFVKGRRSPPASPTPSGRAWPWLAVPPRVALKNVPQFRAARRPSRRAALLGWPASPPERGKRGRPRTHCSGPGRGGAQAGLRLRGACLADRGRAGQAGRAGQCLGGRRHGSLRRRPAPLRSFHPPALLKLPIRRPLRSKLGGAGRGGPIDSGGRTGRVASKARLAGRGQN